MPKRTIKRPWMPLYVDDWLNDGEVAAIPLPGRSCYKDLLLHEWKEGSIPSGPPRLLAILCRCSEEEFTAVQWSFMHKFVLSEEDGPGRLINVKLERIYSAMGTLSANQSRRAQTGWINRKVPYKDASPGTHRAMPRHMPDECLQRSESEYLSHSRARVGEKLDLANTWMEETGLLPGDLQELLALRQRVNELARLQQSDPDTLFIRVVRAFVAWVDGIDNQAMRPQKSPRKLLHNWEMVQEIAVGKRLAKPVDSSVKPAAPARPQPLPYQPKPDNREEPPAEVVAALAKLRGR